MTSIDDLAAQVKNINTRVEELAARSPWFSAVVTAADASNGLLTVQDASGTEHEVSALLGFVPQVGSTVLVALNGSDAIVIPPPFTMVPGNAMRSTDFLAGSDGWEIDAAGNVEFNQGVFRGTLEAGEVVSSRIVSVTGPELLTDGGFEVGISLWGQTPSDGSTFSQSTDEPRNGTYSFKWITDQTIPNSMQTSGGTSGIPVVAGRMYRYEIWALATEEDSSASVTLDFWDEDGNHLEAYTPNPLDIGVSEYRRLSVAEVAVDGAAFASLRFNAYHTGGSTFYFDDASLREVSLIRAGRVEVGDDPPMKHSYESNESIVDEYHVPMSHPSWPGAIEAKPIYGESFGHIALELRGPNAWVNGNPKLRLMGLLDDTGSIGDRRVEIENVERFLIEGFPAVTLIASAQLDQSGNNSASVTTDALVIPNGALLVSFDGPPSGRVLIEMNGYARITGNASGAIGVWGLRTLGVATAIAKSLTRVVQVSGAFDVGANVHYLKEFAVTPGASYVWYWGHRLRNTGTGRELFLHWGNDLEGIPNMRAWAIHG